MVVDLSEPKFDVFLSYNRLDYLHIQAAEHSLTAAGLKVCVDYQNLTPGSSWIPTIEKAIAASTSVAVFVGANGLGRWQSREYQLALILEKAIIPVLLPDFRDDPPLGFLALSTWLDLRCSDISLLAAAVRGGSKVESPTPSFVCPYRGLAFFREEDAALYFGRETRIEELAAHFPNDHFIALAGSSGSGKSSILRAGLAHRLHLDRQHSWEILTFVPNTEPLFELGRVLASALYPGEDRIEKARDISRNLYERKVPLRDYARELSEKTDCSRILLMVDQWEELYTVARDQMEIRLFIDELLDAAERKIIHVVFAYRADFLGEVIAHKGLAHYVRTAQVLLDPMTPAQLREAIEKPAQRAGSPVDSILTDELLKDVASEPGNLPLLEFVLRQLWESGHFTLHSYHGLGSLDGALSTYADAVYSSLQIQDRSAARRVFLKTVRLGESGPETRRRATRAEIGDGDWRIVPLLANKRLLVTGSGGNVECVEICHEALIRHWKELRKWLDADREFLLWRERLGGYVNEWQKGNSATGLLLPEPLLSEASQWRQSKMEDLSDQELDFICKSLDVAEQRGEAERIRVNRELENARKLADEQTARLLEQRRNARRLSLALVGVVLGLFGAIFFLFQARNDQSRAEKARKDAEELVNFMIFALPDELEPAGRSDILAEINQKVDEYYKSQGSRVTIGQAYGRLGSFLRQGDNDINRGNLVSSLKSYRSALSIAEQLTKYYPANTLLLHAQIESHGRIAVVQDRQGAFADAFQSYQAARSIAEKLAKDEPSNTRCQFDLATIYGGIGNIRANEGDFVDALIWFQKALSIIGQLVTPDSGDAKGRQELSIAHDKIGDAEAHLSNLDAAMDAYQAALHIREKLDQQDLNNPIRRRNISISLNKIGDVQLHQRDLAAALRSYQVAFSIAKELTAKDPHNIEWQHDLAVSYSKLAITFDRLHRPLEAKSHALRCLAITESISKTDPTNASWQSELVSIKSIIARFK